jgi:hypothetical protein
MPDIGVPSASALPVYRTLNLLKKGRKVLGPDLNCSESVWRAEDNTPQETGALRDFRPVNVRYGS